MVENLGLRSGKSNKPVFLRFVNNTNREANVIWIDYNGLPQKYCTLEPDGHFDVTTYLGHPWIFEDNNTRDKLAADNQYIFFPPNWTEMLREKVPNVPTNISSYRIVVMIRIPVYSLRDRCLQIVRDSINLDHVANVDDLQLPKSVLDDLYKVLLRKHNYI